MEFDHGRPSLRCDPYVYHASNPTAHPFARTQVNLRPMSLANK